MAVPAPALSQPPTGTPPWPKEAPPSYLLDTSTMRLSLRETKLESSISDLVGNSLSAKPGFKLVVVKLSGNIPWPCAITHQPGEFSAVFETESQDDAAKRTAQTVIVQAAAIQIGTGWVIPGEGTTVTFTSFRSEAGPLEIQVAFVLPENVRRFAVRFPALTKGVVEVP